MKPQQGFLAAAVREFYTDLSKAKHDDPRLVNALKFAKRCYEKYLANDFGEEPSKKRFRESGAGRKDLLRDVYQRKCFVQSVSKFILIGLSNNLNQFLRKNS